MTEDNGERQTEMPPLTAEAYAEFVIPFTRKKNVGSKEAPQYIQETTPYMTVEGRLKWAIDDHRRHGQQLSMETTFLKEPVSGQLLCRAEIISDLLGRVIAHARVFVDGGGVNATNPLENAETSAIGRALGLLGYGLVGSGVASAEEVSAAVDAGASDGGDRGGAASPVLKRMFATLRKQGVDLDLFRTYLRVQQIASSKELTPGQCSAIIRLAETQGPAGFVADVDARIQAGFALANTLPTHGWRTTLLATVQALYAAGGLTPLVSECLDALTDIQTPPGRAEHLRERAQVALDAAPSVQEAAS